MKKLLLLSALLILGCSGQIIIDTPNDYSEMNNDKKGVIYAVEKIN